ncbi:MAG: hypothetical protein HRU09_03135 [Oligoflexales bacterium]|nr:hypothetical protein [Oligoflexales bacterium]
MNSKQSGDPIDDRCPEWAAKMIAQLREVEVYLGNIPKALEWESSHLNDVAKRSLSKDHSAINEQTSELVFAKIVKSLHHEGFSSSEIEQFLNSRIAYKGGPKYCNSSEIEEVL